MVKRCYVGVQKDKNCTKKKSVVFFFILLFFLVPSRDILLIKEQRLIDQNSRVDKKVESTQGLNFLRFYPTCG